MALTRFTFEADGVTIVGEGVVQVTGAPPADEAGVILDFLRALDCEELERQALQRQGWDGQCLTAYVVEILVEGLTGQRAEG